MGRAKPRADPRLAALAALTVRTDVPGVVPTASTSHLPLPANEEAPADDVIDPRQSRRQRRLRLRAEQQTALQEIPEPAQVDEHAVATAETAFPAAADAEGSAADKTVTPAAAPDAVPREPEPLPLDSPASPNLAERSRRGKRGRKGTRFDKPEPGLLQTPPPARQPTLPNSVPDSGREDIVFFTSPQKPATEPLTLADSADAPAAGPPEAAELLLPDGDAPDETAVHLDDQLTFVNHLGQIIDGGELWEHLDGLTSARRGTEYTPQQQRLISQQQCLYLVPDSGPAPAHAVPTEPAPVPDDGIFFGALLPLPQQQRRRFDYRLAKEQREGFSQWFTADGDTVRLPNPLKPAPMRPESLLDAQDLASAAKRLAKFKSPECTSETLSAVRIDALVDQPFVMQIAVQSVEFTNHPLFLAEHDHAFRLKSLNRQYMLRCKLQSSARLTQRLRALKDAEARLQRSLQHLSPANHDLRETQLRRLREYQQEIRSTRQSRDEEDRIDMFVLQDMLATWNELKDLRQHQQFTATQLSLTVLKQESDKDADKAMFAAIPSMCRLK